MNKNQQYKYDRELPTGFGDRLGCIMCVSAMGKAIDLLNKDFKTFTEECLTFEKIQDECLTFETKIHLYWCEKEEVVSEHSAAHRFYPFKEIIKYVRFPSNLIFHTKAELDQLTFPSIQWTNGEIPANFAYDCMPTLGHKTFNHAFLIEGETGKRIDVIDTTTYMMAYDIVAKQFDTSLQSSLPSFQTPLEKTQRPYGVLHVRGGDKADWSPQFVSMTNHIMNEAKKIVSDWILLTDDEKAIELFSAYSTISTKQMEESKESEEQIEIQKIVRDIKILLGAKCIVQHVSHGWSAFSNIPANLRKIPIINTYPQYNTVVRSFYHLGGQPKNYYCYDQLNDFISFMIKS